MNIFTIPLQVSDVFLFGDISYEQNSARWSGFRRVNYSELHRTPRSDPEGAAKTKLFAVIQKNLFRNPSRSGLEKLFGVIIGVTRIFFHIFSSPQKSSIFSYKLFQGKIMIPNYLHPSTSISYCFFYTNLTNLPLNYVKKFLEFYKVEVRIGVEKNSFSKAVGF